MSEVHARFDGFVGVLDMWRRPHNFFDDAVVDDLARAFEAASCAATDHELAEHVRLMPTDDAREGIAADAGRRAPEFRAR